MKRFVKNIATLLAVFFFLARLSYGQPSSSRVEQFNLDAGLAIHGYDPVSYLTVKQAQKGRKEFSFVHQGVRYYFVSSAHLDQFKAAPEKYEPQYGGWCAYAMGESGEKVEVDPETFKIVDGKLYLFYNKYFNNTLKSWNKDEAKLKVNADRNWSKFYR